MGLRWSGSAGVSVSYNNQAETNFGSSNQEAPSLNGCKDCTAKGIAGCNNQRYCPYCGRYIRGEGGVKEHCKFNWSNWVVAAAAMLTAISVGIYIAAFALYANNPIILIQAAPIVSLIISLVCIVALIVTMMFMCRANANIQVNCSMVIFNIFLIVCSAGMLAFIIWFNCDADQTFYGANMCFNTSTRIVGTSPTNATNMTDVIGQA